MLSCRPPGDLHKVKMQRDAAASSRTPITHMDQPSRSPQPKPRGQQSCHPHTRQSKHRWGGPLCCLQVGPPKSVVAPPCCPANSKAERLEGSFRSSPSFRSPLSFPSPSPALSAMTTHPSAASMFPAHKNAGHVNLTRKLGYFEPCSKIAVFDLKLKRLIIVKTGDSSTCLISYSPLKFQKNLCLASTGALKDDKTRKQNKKISEAIFGFSQINISSEAIETVSKPNSAFIITISKFAFCEQLCMESILPSASERLHWLPRNYSPFTILGENICLTEVGGITFIDFHKLEVHPLKLKIKPGPSIWKDKNL